MAALCAASDERRHFTVSEEACFSSLSALRRAVANGDPSPHTHTGMLSRKGKMNKYKKISRPMACFDPHTKCGVTNTQSYALSQGWDEPNGCRLQPFISRSQTTSRI